MANKKYITMEQIQKDPELKKKILGQINVWYQESEEYMSKKRSLFQARYEKFTNPSESVSDKVKVYMLFQHLKSFISTYYSEGLSVEMTGKEFLDDDYAYMLEVCAKQDYKTMSKKQKDFFHILNIGFYGVSILLETGYDSINNHINYKVVSPKYWLPDPHGNIVNGFRYHMFDFSISEEEIKNINSRSKTGPIYYNVDKYQKGIDEANATTNKEKSDRALNADVMPNIIEGTNVMLERDGVKYMCDTFNSRSEIGRWERIMPVDKEEEKHPSLIPFPVTVVNMFPLENDPCGIGLAELIISFQNAKNRLTNMSLKKEEWNAGFRVLLADISKITDIDLLAERPTEGPIIVPFDSNLGAAGGNLVTPVMDGIQADQSTINLASILDREAQMNTGYTEAVRGVGVNPGETLGQTKINQVNSNLVFSLDSEIISRGEVSFWRDMWLRGLKRNLPANQKKFARLGSGIASNDVIVTREDIREHGDPDITVRPLKTATEANKQKADIMLAREALIMANPAIPAISKVFYQRDIEKLKGFPREETLLRFPRTADENRAIDYVKQINLYESFTGPKNLKEQLKPEALFYSGMDLWTYYIYIQKAKDGKLKRDILAKIQELMKMEGIAKQVQPSDGMAMGSPDQLRNSMSSQLTSNVVQQSGTVNNFPTRQDILA